MQHDYVLDNASGLAFRGDLNDALEAIVSLNSGASEPTTMYAFMLWADTANNLLKIRNAANSAWVSIGSLSAANLGLLALSGGTLTGALLVALGTVGAPGISFTGDANTGIYSSGADIMGLVAAGVEYLRVSSAGVDLLGTGAVKVPVGTTGQQPSPTNGMIRYNSTSAKFEGYEAGAWKDLIPSAGVRSHRNATTTDSITTGDDTVVFSGASFTATLPTAVGNSGKQFTLEHGGTSLTQIYTLATTSAQTIGGIASGAYVLYTNGECLKVESNGANWIIVDHYANTEWIDAGTLTIGAVTTGPTKGTTTTDKVYWKREGNICLLKYRYVQTGAGAAGSGNYLVSIPSGITPDTTHTDVYTGTDAQTKMTTMLDSNINLALPGSNLGVMHAILYNTTQFRVHGILDAASSIDFTSGSFPLSSASLRLYGWVRLPVSGWRP